MNYLAKIGKFFDKFNKLALKLGSKFIKTKVYALVGPAGTGKSFRAHLIADKHNISLIIDDGLLIKNMEIIAGSSSKFEQNIIGAIKRSIFENVDHRNEIINALEKENFNKILILGTSLKMIDKIIERLNMPKVFKIIYITDISTKQEIEKAKVSRQMGEHVIPAASFEITSLKPNIFLDSIRVFFKRDFPFFKKKNYIRYVVKPNFYEEGILSISKEAIQQVIEHCISEYNNSYIVHDLKIRKNNNGYSFRVLLNIPLGNDLLKNTEMLRAYVIKNVLKYTVIQISTIDIVIHKFYDNDKRLEIRTNG